MRPTWRGLDVLDVVVDCDLLAVCRLDHAALHEVRLVCHQDHGRALQHARHPEQLRSDAAFSDAGGRHVGNV